MARVSGDRYRCIRTIAQVLSTMLRKVLLLVAVPGRGDGGLAVMQRRSMVAVLVGGWLPLVAAHGHMTLPPSRNGGTLAKAGQCRDGECAWFSQPASIPGSPTLNSAALRSMNVEVNGGALDYTRKMPWRAPGAAPVIGTGCGRAGGGPHVESGNGGDASSWGLKQNVDGYSLPEVGGPGNRTVWHRNSSSEVAWSVNSNHGGGYSYRLCKLEAGVEPSEAYFQRTPLHFSSAAHTLLWEQRLPSGAITSRRVEIPAAITSTGTTPAGSSWARNPIPACMFCPSSIWGAAYRGDCQAECGTSPLFVNKTAFWREMACPAMTSGNGLTRCPRGTAHFAEPLPGLSGFYTSYHRCLDGEVLGERANDVCAGDDTCPESGAVEDETCKFGCECSRAMMLEVNIVDRVDIPATLQPGHYLVSWRWDAEQSPQVWQNCGDVDIV